MLEILSAALEQGRDQLRVLWDAADVPPYPHQASADRLRRGFDNQSSLPIDQYAEAYVSLHVLHKNMRDGIAYSTDLDTRVLRPANGLDVAI